MQKLTKKQVIKGGLPAFRCYSKLMFFVLFLRFPFFFPLVTERDEKLVFAQKQTISASEQCAEHPFAGQNTQHPELFFSSFYMIRKGPYNMSNVRTQISK